MSSPLHQQDSDCTVDSETLLCIECGVDHSDSCLDCGGRGFHKPTCSILLAEQQEAEEYFSEPNDDVSCGICPDCERSNQFGELCDDCRREQEVRDAEVVR